MKDNLVFGYGSLVNNATHDYENPVPARLHGWQRAWSKSPDRKICRLTIIPSPGAIISGMAFQVRQTDWEDLNEREAAYDLISASGEIVELESAPIPLKTYAIPSNRYATPDQTDQILLSYLDTVIQGFYNLYDDAGVHSFFETTGQWHATIIDDRKAPIYARYQRLTQEQRDLVDHYLAKLPAKIEKL